MSNLGVDLNYQYWEMYLRECAVLEIKPSMSDYQIWLDDMNLDRKENYDE